MVRLMLIVVDTALRGEVEALLRKTGVHGFTEIAAAAGWGATGMKLGSGAYPDTATLLMTALDRAAEERVRVALAGYEEAGGRRVRAYAWDAEEVT